MSITPITGSPLSRENIRRTTELGRKLREAREAMRRALDTKQPRAAAEVEAVNLANEFRHGSICFTNEADGREIIMGISPSFPNVFA